MVHGDVSSIQFILASPQDNDSLSLSSLREHSSPPLFLSQSCSNNLGFPFTPQDFTIQTPFLKSTHLLFESPHFCFTSFPLTFSPQISVSEIPQVPAPQLLSWPRPNLGRRTLTPTTSRAPTKPSGVNYHSSSLSKTQILFFNFSF